MKLVSVLVVIFAGLIISLPTLTPLFRQEFFHMHDYTHVARLVEMHEALLDGHFPVRWSRNLGYGYGLPQFNFYAPLAYYIAEVFHLLGFSPLNSIKLLMIFNTLASFVFMYYAASRLWGRWAGLLAGTAFVYAPYRAVDMYVRGALGELTAITMLSAVVMCLIYWHFNKSWKWVGLGALAIGAMIVSHNLVALLAMPVILGMLIVLVLVSQRENRIKYLSQGIVILILGLLLSSFYALPAYFEKGFTQVDALTQGFSDYNHHFLYLRQFVITNWGYGGSIAGIDDDISFTIGLVQIGLLFLAGLALLLRWHVLKRIDKTMMIGSAAVIAISALMSTYKAKFIWDALPFMAFVQFPWRYLSVIIVFASLLAGSTILLVWGHLFRKMTFTLIIMGLLVRMNYQFFRPAAYLESNESLYYTNPDRIAREMSGIIPDFIPSIKDELPLEPPKHRFEIRGEANEFDIEIDRVHEFFLVLHNFNEEILRVNIFDYPGWQMYLNGKPIDHDTDKHSGLMSIAVPGVQDLQYVSGKFEETQLRMLSNILSFVALLGIMYLLIPHKKGFSKNE